MFFRSTRWFLGIAVGGALSLAANSAFAQITPDATLPNNSTVTINGNTFNIDGGTTAGRNLFHSFQQFSVLTGNTASFNNAADIQNIFSRVTGASPSNIDGIIKASGTANLFFINPNGIIFGPNARLDVGGSFVGTTANAIQFGNQGFFSATNPNNPALLTINPSVLFFNQIAAASIQNNSSLRVPDGKSLLLVGGNVNMDGGRLNAYGGRVELGGLAASGNVGLNVDGDKLSASFPTESALADVSLTNAGVRVDASRGGNIIINARNLDITGSVFSAGIGSNLGSDGTVAGDIVLNAKGKITLVDSNIFNDVFSSSEGKGGNIQIKADSLSLTNDASLSAFTLGKGDAGNVIIDVRGNVSFDNSRASTLVGFTAEGKTGNIQIKADSLSLTNDASLSAFTLGKGDAGNVIIDVRGNVSFDNSRASTSVGFTAEGKTGNIQIKADSLSLTNDASLSAETFGKGDAGNVIIDVRGNVSFDNSRASTSGSFTAEGKTGNIQIKADSLSLTNDASLSAETFGKGDAGNVIIDVRGNVSFDNSRASTSGSFTAEGKTGNIQIKADSLSLTNDASLSAYTAGKGDAGNVIIDVRGNVSFDNSRASTSVGFTAEGKGGNIQISADSLSLTNGARLETKSFFDDSQVTTVVLDGEGKGGNIQISADSLSLTNGARLETNSYGKGNAGNVIIDVRGNVSFDNSRASTSGGQGKSGNIQVRADSLSLTNGARLETDSYGKGDAGNVIIDVRGNVSFDRSSIDTKGEQGKTGNIQIGANSLSLTNFARLEPYNFGQGDAGNVIIDVRGNVSFDDSFIVSIAGQGKGGNIQIKADSLSLTNDASLFANSFGQGDGGNIEVTARQIRLVDNGSINATSKLGNGGNINLQVRDLLLLRRGSQISTSTGGTNQQGGNGGNITINAPSGFIVSVPNENSDITANAFNGSGGKININSLNIFSFTQRSREDLVRELGTNDPNLLNPQRLQTNDITAFSLTNPILSGQININTPDIDPSRGLVQLPVDVFDLSNQITQGCSAFDQPNASDFQVTGRGGLPPSPDEPLSSDAVWEDTRLGATTPQRLDSKTTATKPKSESDTVEIIPATGWVFNGKGEVTLVSHTPNGTAENLAASSQSCRIR